MRTTLTLDEDVLAGLEQVQKLRRTSFEAAVNETLRAGLLALAENKESPKPYVTEPWDAGRCRLANVDNITKALAIAEGEENR